jgi:tryptophan-rich sensory protein
VKSFETRADEAVTFIIYIKDSSSFKEVLKLCYQLYFLSNSVHTQIFLNQCFLKQALLISYIRTLFYLTTCITFRQGRIV